MAERRSFDRCPGAFGSTAAPARLACLLVAALGFSLSGCTTVQVPKSYSSDSTQDQTSAAAVCSAARLFEIANDSSDTAVNRAVRCADTLAGEYVVAADEVAANRQKYRYAEITLSTLTLGLAGFEAHNDTLKAAGLATGATTVANSSQQFAKRVSALQKASTRLRCVVDNARSAQMAESRLTGIRLSILHLTRSSSMLSGNGNPSRLLSTIIDTIGAIEQSAQAEFRFSEHADAPSDTISKAISDAIELGEKIESERAETLRFDPEDGRRAILLNGLNETSKFEESLIKLAACASG